MGDYDLTAEEMTRRHDCQDCGLAESASHQGDDVWLCMDCSGESDGQEWMEE
mgnify:FL=1